MTDEPVPDSEIILYQVEDGRTRMRSVNRTDGRAHVSGADSHP